MENKILNKNNWKYFFNLQIVNESQVLESAGFVNVRAEDKTDMFVDMLKRELKRTTAIKDDFIQASENIWY